jgi:hypothetical protein
MLKQATIWVVQDRFEVGYLIDKKRARDQATRSEEEWFHGVFLVSLVWIN